jgi:dihydroorotase-like cyclic amidohydrolase
MPAWCAPTRRRRIKRPAPDIETVEAREVFDAKNFLAFPGCVDAHMHIGMPLAQDAVSESKAAAMGGVTSSLNYIRTGLRPGEIDKRSSFVAKREGNFSNGVSRRDGTASLDAPRSQVPAFPRQD